MHCRDGKTNSALFGLRDSRLCSEDDLVKRADQEGHLPCGNSSRRVNKDWRQSMSMRLIERLTRCYFRSSSAR